MQTIRITEANASHLIRREHILNGLSRVARTDVISDDAALCAYRTGALGISQTMPLAVVLPRTTAEVSRILKFCNQNRVKAVARGGGTSVSGGVLPPGDSIVIGLSRMNRVLDINIVDRTATVEAGITNAEISKAVVHARLFYAPDPSRGAASTIGGNVATNAGGPRSLKYGVTANNVLKVKVVLTNGDVVELGGDYLDGQGYNLLGLVMGSEGQFGIVTEVTVRLLRQAEGARLILIGFTSSKEAGACAAAIIAAGLTPVAMEFMNKTAVQVCEPYAKAGYPLDAEAMLIVELEGSEHEIGGRIDDIEEIAARFGPTSFRVSQSEKEVAAIWKGRKASLAAAGRNANFFCADGVVPLTRLVPVLQQIEETARAANLDAAIVASAGQGHLETMILYNGNDEREKEAAERCAADSLKLCVDAGGSLSGGHGIGLAKRDLMRTQYSDADLRQQMRVKAAFDPEWLLNSGKVFPLDLQSAFAAEAETKHG